MGGYILDVNSRGKHEDVYLPATLVVQDQGKTYSHIVLLVTYILLKQSPSKIKPS